MRQRNQAFNGCAIAPLCISARCGAAIRKHFHARLRVPAAVAYSGWKRHQHDEVTWLKTQQPAALARQAFVGIRLSMLKFSPRG